MLLLHVRIDHSVNQLRGNRLHTPTITQTLHGLILEQVWHIKAVWMLFKNSSFINTLLVSWWRKASTLLAIVYVWVNRRCYGVFSELLNIYIQLNDLQDFLTFTKVKVLCYSQLHQQSYFLSHLLMKQGQTTLEKKYCDISVSCNIFWSVLLHFVQLNFPTLPGGNGIGLSLYCFCLSLPLWKLLCF